MATMQIDRAVVERALHVAESAGYPVALIKDLRAALAQQAELVVGWMDPASGDVISAAQRVVWNEDFGQAGQRKAALFSVPLRAALAQPVPHGCHVDLHPGMKPDGCVLDGGRPETCIYAKRLFREGKDKTACEYWQPIEVTQ